MLKKYFNFLAVAKVRQGFLGKKGKGIGDIREEKKVKINLAWSLDTEDETRISKCIVAAGVGAG